MYIIKPCPICGKKIRFPIDRGKIRVTCECGGTLLADPDDPTLYKDAAFDLQTSAGKKSRDHPFNKLLLKLQESCKNFNLKDIFSNTINRLFDYKYKIQNFRILPTTEQKRILLIFLIIAILIGTIIFLISMRTGKVEMDEMTI
jgi:hypothetical protein